MKGIQDGLLHIVILVFAFLTLAPFLFVMNNSFRTNSEMNHSFFGVPAAIVDGLRMVAPAIRNDPITVSVEDSSGPAQGASPREALRLYAREAVRGYTIAWNVVRPYMLNSFVVSGLTALGVVFIGSLTAYVLSRYRFMGSRAVFYFIISTMMFPGVLTLVPSFMLVKDLGLLNTYGAMILPYLAGGQVFAIFVFKSFFDGLPEELFESARIDGAGHLQMYWHIVIPLSKPVLSVVMVMNILGTWNNFLWPFITNTEGKYHVIASGLYVLATSSYNQDFSTLLAAYMISSLPLLVLFVYATRPFIQGVTAGAFKA